METFRDAAPAWDSDAYACGVSVSLKLGKKLKAQGRIIELDIAGFNELAAEQLDDNTRSQTNFFIRKQSRRRPSTTGQHKYNSPVNKTKGILSRVSRGARKAPGERSPHELIIFLKAAQIRKGVVDNDKVTKNSRHELRHAFDTARLGPNEFTRQYALRHLIWGTPAYAGSIAAFLTEDYLLPADPNVVSSSIVFAGQLATSMFVGLSVGYKYNLYEVKAREVAGQENPFQPQLVQLNEAAHLGQA